MTVGVRRWTDGDPEPDAAVQRVRDCLGDLWWRVPEPEHPASAGYHWFNGDKLRPWFMLAGNHGPLALVEESDGAV